MRYDTISFLSDYGTGDEFVGVVKSVIRQIARGVRRGRPHPRDPRLRRARRGPHAWPRRPVPLPGRGAGGRRPGRRHGAAGDRGRGRRRARVLVGPDNGLLAPGRGLVRRRDRGGRAHQPRASSSPPRARPSPAGTSSPPRPPTSAAACPSRPRPPIDPLSLLPGPHAAHPAGGRRARGPRCCGSTASATAAERRPRRGRVALRSAACTSAGMTTSAPPSGSHTYEGLAAGELGLVVDSYGLLSICLGRRSAADELRLGRGTEVTLSAPTDDERRPARPSPSPRRRGREARHHARPRHPPRAHPRRRRAPALLHAVSSSSVASDDSTTRAASWSRVKRLAPPRMSERGDRPR